MVVKSFDNVWGALTDTPAHASSMTARSDLRLAIQRAVAGWGLSQEAAAMRLGITRARASDLLNARIAKFALDALTNLAANAASNVRQRLTPAFREAAGSDRSTASINVPVLFLSFRVIGGMLEVLRWRCARLWRDRVGGRVGFQNSREGQACLGIGGRASRAWRSS